MTAEPEVVILKVALKGAKRIWRRIAIRTDQTLDDLHSAIFRAFDRYDEHLYSFYMSAAKGTSRRRLMDALSYSSPACFEGRRDLLETKQFNAVETRIGDLKLKCATTFEYLFDFGDEWWHEVTVEGVEALQAKVKYPRVIECRGDSPPQYPDPEDE